MKYKITKMFYMCLLINKYIKLGIEYRDLKKSKTKDNNYLYERERENVIGKDYIGDFKCKYSTFI